MDAYKFLRKSKLKWYMRLFYFLLDVAVVNAHINESERPNHVLTCSFRKEKEV